MIKLYHKEDGTSEIDKLINENEVEKIYLSAVSSVEFYSALSKKVRMGEITSEYSQSLFGKFERVKSTYDWIPDDDSIKSKAIALLVKYGSAFPLRTLDAIQLATAISIRDEAAKFISSDIVLNKLFTEEKLFF